MHPQRTRNRRAGQEEANSSAFFASPLHLVTRGGGGGKMRGGKRGEGAPCKGHRGGNEKYRDDCEMWGRPQRAEGLFIPFPPPPFFTILYLLSRQFAKTATKTKDRRLQLAEKGRTAPDREKTGSFSRHHVYVCECKLAHVYAALPLARCVHTFLFFAALHFCFCTHNAQSHPHMRLYTHTRTKKNVKEEQGALNVNANEFASLSLSSLSHACSPHRLHVRMCACTRVCVSPALCVCMCVCLHECPHQHHPAPAMTQEGACSGAR